MPFQCKMKNLMMDLEMNCSEQGGLDLVTHNELISIHSATSLPEALLCDHLQQSVTQIPEDLMSPFGFCKHYSHVGCTYGYQDSYTQL